MTERTEAILDGAVMWTCGVVAVVDGLAGAYDHATYMFAMGLFYRFTVHRYANIRMILTIQHEGKDEAP
jgi:hypothetical protein